MVCTAIAKETGLVNQFDFSRGGIHEIKFTVDGVELNFLNVINKIDEIHSDMVKKEAGRMYTEEFDRRADEINEELDRISHRLKEIRDEKFPEIYWGDSF